MPINSLPPSTVRLLGSSVTITSPLFLVKELVDNSIDANASSIEVILSRDTVSKIQVRDNGSGIDIDDFNSLGRRAHTSKLRTFNELRTKGGQTLGFRGEALASVNSMATVKLTTKTAKDPVAWHLQLTFGIGGVQEKLPVSGTLGTTVQVLKLFENLPVRKQNAVKECSKTLAKIKSLLQSYALARPYLKLSLKVLGESGQSWSYSPCSTGGVREAVLQLFGTTLATQCVQVSTDPNANEGDARGSAELILTAFLPAPECEPWVVKDKGPFISVDSRPISSTRGTGKKLYAIFKPHLSQRHGWSDPDRTPTSPFMQLNVKCVAGSYDPNVAPLKDELLFADEQQVLNAFDTLCEQLYKRKEVTTNRTDGLSRLQQNDEQGGGGRPPAHESRQELFGVNDLEDVADGFPPDSTGLEHISGGTGAQNDRLHRENSRPAGPSRDQEVAQELEEATEPSPLQARMRTLIGVNLERKESDQSDGNASEGLILVQVNPRRRPSKPTPSQSGVRTRPRQSALAHPLEDISLYLEPATDRPIQIATDDTATPGPAPDSRLVGEVEQPLQSRQPLNELSNATLNQIREEPVINDFSGPEPDILRPHNALRGDLERAAIRAGPSVVAGGIEPETPIRRLDGWPSHLSSSPVQHPLGRDVATRRPRLLRASVSAALQTPPSPDPVQREWGPNHPFRPPRRRELDRDSYPLLGISEPADDVDTSGTRQTRIYFGQSPHELPRTHQERELRMARLHTNEKQQQGYQSMNGGHNSSPSTLPRPPFQHLDALHDELESETMRRPRLWSHTNQVLLMRTPPPPDKDLGVEDNCESDALEEHESMARQARRMSSRRSRTRSTSNTSTTEDPRMYFMERRRLISLSGQLKRLRTTKLPLETTPAKSQMNLVRLVVDFELAEIESSARQLDLDPCFSNGGVTRGLEFRNMNEAGQVEGRLRNVVDVWAAKVPGVGVTYTLRSEVKGKSRV